jgi:Dna[CI] antecedent DciA-like protein
MLHHQLDRQSNHVGVRPINALDELRGEALNGVSSGFIHGLTACDVLFDLLAREWCKPNARHGAIMQQLGVPPQTDAGDDFVLAASELRQYACSVGSIAWLAQNLAPNHDHGIRAQHDITRGCFNRHCFFLGHTPDVLFHRLAGMHSLINIGRFHNKRNARLPENLATAGRLGGQDQHFLGRIIVIQFARRMRLRAKFADQSSTRSMLECLIPANMERASKVLGKLNLPEGTVTPEAMVCAVWANAVGKRIAAHSRAVKIVRSHLIVEVEDAVWQRQLFALRGQVGGKIQECIGAGIVEDIEFRVAPRRIGPARAQHSMPHSDDADDIADPVLRNLYKASRKRELA